MADNVGYTPGTGATVAADNIGDVLFQRVKVTTGADGVANDVSTANPMPVEIQGSIPVTIASAIEITNDAGNAIPVSASALPLPSGAATEATLGSIAAAIRAEDTPHLSGDVGVMSLAVRADGETTLSIPDGDYAPLQVNAVGRLKVSTQPGLYDLVEGNITGATQTVFCGVDRASNVMLHVVANPSFGGHNCTFEGSIDSTNGTDGAWFVIQVVRSNANTIETTTGVLAATPAYAWEASVNGLSFVRVRATAHTTGTARWKIQRGSYATEPIPAAQASATQPVSGTVTSNIGTSGMVVYTDSSTNLGSAGVFTGTSRDGGATPAYNFFIANVQADQAGTIRVEKSTDNTNWRRASKDIAVTANAPEEVTVKVTSRYNRVVYTNGGVAQTQFLLTSAYHRI
jgi:hypothetical protein